MVYSYPMDTQSVTRPIPGADPRFTITRWLEGFAYPANGNVHNPTPRYLWLLKLDGEQVDQATSKRALVESARQPNAVRAYST